MSILEALGNPILSASLPGDSVEEYTDPEHIHEVFGSRVDIVVDGGPGGIIPSTVVDCISGSCEIIRQGKGILEA
jgi:tRNA A37 threonylcarbamoyladenosine synthetase subunit TsaC/SUA5/YrdC